jgi:GWxTD domain-containing protein
LVPWSHAALLLCTAILLISSPEPLGAKANYKKWLEEEVVWIISNKERSTFLALRTDQEKDEFIRKFWERRDPTPSTPRNEYKEEHYRRFEYVIKHFQEGTPGWKTDRGRVYIIHGPAVREEFFTSNSKMDVEGRGNYLTRTPNTIVWTYHGDSTAHYYRGELVLVFQPIGGMSRQNFALGESKTAQDKADELNRQFGGATDPTWMESDIRYRLVMAGPPALVTARGAEIPTSGLGEVEHYKADLLRSPGEVLEESLAKAEALRAAKKNLREAVETHLSFGDLPLALSSYSHMQPDGTYRVQLRIDIPGSGLAAQLQKDGKAGGESRLDLYCALKTPAGSIADEFVDSALVSPALWKDGSPRDLHYANVFSIPAGDYTLLAAVRSGGAGRLGYREEKIALKQRGGSRLQVSDVLVTDQVHSASAAPSADEESLFSFGDLRFAPSARPEFEASKSVLIYLQILLPGGKGLADCDLSLGMNFISGQRIVKQLEPRKIAETNSGLPDLINFATLVKLESFPPGDYTLQVQAIDHRSRDFSIQRTTFSVK